VDFYQKLGVQVRKYLEVQYSYRDIIPALSTIDLMTYIIGLVVVVVVVVVVNSSCKTVYS
jgi:hypothetical protein